MPNEDHAAPKAIGIAGLPKGWAVTVQLVGTFGLAVFLVLYYVLVLQPREAKRYKELSDSVRSLEEIVVGEKSLLTREQATRLEALFVIAAAHEAADLIARELKREAPAEGLAKKIEDMLIDRTDLLQGLRRRDGGVVSEMLTHKIRNSGIGQKIAEAAVAEWKDADTRRIAYECRDRLLRELKHAAMGK